MLSRIAFILLNPLVLPNSIEGIKSEKIVAASITPEAKLKRLLLSFSFRFLRKSEGTAPIVVAPKPASVTANNAVLKLSVILLIFKLF